MTAVNKTALPTMHLPGVRYFGHQIMAVLDAEPDVVISFLRGEERLLLGEWTKRSGSMHMFAAETREFGYSFGVTRNAREANAVVQVKPQSVLLLIFTSFVDVLGMVYAVSSRLEGGSKLTATYEAYASWYLIPLSLLTRSRLRQEAEKQFGLIVADIEEHVRLREKVRDAFGKI